MSDPGEAAEAEALAIIREYFPDAEISRGSGNVHGDSDIQGVPGVQIEVKHQSRNVGFTVRKAEWEKLRQQSANWSREPVLVVMNKESDILACCSLDLLLLALSYVPEGVL